MLTTTICLDFSIKPTILSDYELSKYNCIINEFLIKSYKRLKENCLNSITLS